MRVISLFFVVFLGFVANATGVENVPMVIKTIEKANDTVYMDACTKAYGLAKQTAIATCKALKTGSDLDKVTANEVQLGVEKSDFGLDKNNKEGNLFCSITLYHTCKNVTFAQAK